MRKAFWITIGIGNLLAIPFAVNDLLRGKPLDGFHLALLTLLFVSNALHCFGVAKGDA